MPSIIIDNMTVRLASEMQNTFNPGFAFGPRPRGGSLALRDTQNGHLLLPFDAEGNVAVAPGRRYELLLVREKKAQGDAGFAAAAVTHHREELDSWEDMTTATKAAPKAAPKAVPKAAPKEVTTTAPKTAPREVPTAPKASPKAVPTAPKEVTTTAPTATPAVPAAAVDKKQGVENGKKVVAAEAAANRERKRRQEREQERRNQPPVTPNGESGAPQRKKEKTEKETTRDDTRKGDDDDDIPLYRTLGRKPSSSPTVKAKSPVAALKTSSELPPPLAAEKLPKSRAPQHSPSSSSDLSDDDNIPLSMSYARRQQKSATTAATNAVAAPEIRAAKQTSHRQPRQLQRPPVETPTTSESD